MNWDVRHQIRVVIKEDKYLVHSLTPYGDPTGVNRYYTDETLPDEIKAKLGMALFGMRGNGISDVVREVGGKSRWVDLWIGMRTYSSIRGEMRHDTRSKSKSASAQNPE